jgi:hypothetical protein
MDRPRDNTPTLPADIAVGLLAGLVATRAYGLAQEALARPMPEGRQGARGAAPARAHLARRGAEGRRGARIQPRRSTARAGHAAVHYGLGLAWGPVYGLLRRHARMRPLAAGLATGAAMSLVVDEALVPAWASARRTGPSRRSPTSGAS